jgi:16S rRNA (guanine966-N2)-methyltransferase
VRIVAGAWRGRVIETPRTRATRPTADRVRQALFDMLSHAPWAAPWPDCVVLDGFAGSGALGLEAMSRGASRAVFFENGRAALDSLRRNVTLLDAGPRSTVLAADATRPPPALPGQGGCTLLFLDPPYGKALVAQSLGALRSTGWIAPGALIVAETARDEDPPIAAATLLAERRHGAARISVWREPEGG